MDGQWTMQTEYTHTYTKTGRERDLTLATPVSSMESKGRDL